MRFPPPPTFSVSRLRVHSERKKQDPGSLWQALPTAQGPFAGLQPLLPFPPVPLRNPWPVLRSFVLRYSTASSMLLIRLLALSMFCLLLSVLSPYCPLLDLLVCC